MTIYDFWRAITYRDNDIRAGQEAFNILAANRVDGIERCRASKYDPFYRYHTVEQLQEWVAVHLLIDDDGEIISVEP